MVCKKAEQGKTSCNLGGLADGQHPFQFHDALLHAPGHGAFVEDLRTEEA